MNGENGKGDRYRPVDRKKWDKNWPFREKRLNIWPRDKKGNLVKD